MSVGGKAPSKLGMDALLDFDVKLIWDRQNNPAPSADGTFPKPNDIRLFFGLGWEF